MTRKYNLSDNGREAKHKKFILEVNQNVWDQYEQLKLNNGSNVASIRQYKPAVTELEKYIDADLTQLTVTQLDEFINSNIITNTSHVRGFLITCISEGLMKVDKNVVAYLIPAEYKKLVEILIA